ncbi:prepilin-type N-terminal cleavage/methylation domain-containing protein [bacterium]|nr:prepilin-type N-terminal cleavage/methylation domain-containing protein [bacterium]
MLNQSSRRGFTLIELLVVIVIIGILVTLSIPRFADFRRKARETETAANVKKIQTALESFGADNNGNYPFKVRYFNQATYNNPGFDPAASTPTRTSDSNGDYFSLGLIGGVRTVNPDFSDNSTMTAVEKDAGINEHKIVQPFGFSYNDFYQYFNQYSDPLRANGYLDDYPENPFLKRPMGNIMWAYGNANWRNGGAYLYDSTVPYERITPSPGDFVYTFFYRADANGIDAPAGVLPAKKSYQAKSENATFPGEYYIDLVDSYQLWGLGELKLNGPWWQAYPNNAAGAAVPRQEAKVDWNGNGTKDIFELGMVIYYKNASASSSQSTQQGGKPLEF